MENTDLTCDTFIRYFGPSYYSFNYGRIYFVVLDDIGYSGWDAAQTVKGETVGYIDERQLEWLANDLDTQKLLPNIYRASPRATRVREMGG